MAVSPVTPTASSPSPPVAPVTQAQGRNGGFTGRQEAAQSPAGEVGAGTRDELAQAQSAQNQTTGRGPTNDTGKRVDVFG